MGRERKPCDGSRAGADFEDALFCYQLKVRRCLPSWLWRWLGGIQRTASASDRVGVLVLKQPRQEDAEALVVLSWRDWRDLHGTPPETSGAAPAPAPSTGTVTRKDDGS